ncbi:hypothetical protein A1356_17240 [Methylomonas koyamae]|uniref:Uncharacterized protein n=1 Tax=Methylomonas koyamae TaxID=702114 RepID=A0AA91I475_9GAMM|nr:hypothetical protein A1356_17240 [Methylomonas koyamae]
MINIQATFRIDIFHLHNSEVAIRHMLNTAAYRVTGGNVCELMDVHLFCVYYNAAQDRVKALSCQFLFCIKFEDAD